MSARGTAKTPKKQVSDAFKSTSFVEVEDGGKKGGFTTTTGISASGAISSRWKKGEYFYWPQFRLCGDDYLTLIRFAYNNGFPVKGTSEDGKMHSAKRNATLTIAPIICRDPSDSSKATVCEVTVTFGKKSVTMEESGITIEDSMKIPAYRISYSEDEEGDHLDSKMSEKESPISASRYIEHEKKSRASAKKAKDTETRKDANLDALAKRILEHRVPGKSGKSSKKGRSRDSKMTFEAFTEKVNDALKKNDAFKSGEIEMDDLRYNISKLDHGYSGGRTKPRDKVPKSSIRDTEDKRIIFTPDSAAKKGGTRGGPYYYYLLKAEGDADKANQMLKDVLKADKHVFSSSEREAKPAKKSKKDKGKKAKKSKKEESSEAESESS